ncbi:unnamed protein product [Durusdinium trenchii]|uniref:Methyltransferase FkbM domain-containing protein n=1 Tax=Durusdinium trenchii TaxID=1381693 RepID=A0ABP0PJQ0_9DINO
MLAWLRWLPWLPVWAEPEELWELRAKLIKPSAHKAPRYVSFLPGHWLLLLRESRFDYCYWTNVFSVTEANLLEKGFSIKSLHEVSKCGPSIEHGCSFFDAEVIRKDPASASLFNSKAPDGYLGSLIGHYWVGQGSCSEFLDKDPFMQVPSPLRVLHPPGLWGRWLRRSLQEVGLEADSLSDRSLIDTALEAMPEICTDSVTDVWDSQWPDGTTPKSMLVIGCSTMAGEPTQPLIDKGAGGLFLDMDRRAIRVARAQSSAPNRLIMNITVAPHTVGSLLKEYKAFVEDLEVLQVDIDSFDGPMVQALLKLTQPKAVVVEIRDFVPFPFRYACLDSDTKSLPWGGANFAFWQHLLAQHGLYLVRMDHRDAVFARRKAPDRRKFLGIMACYLRQYLLKPNPLQMVGPHTLDQNTIFRQHWISSEPTTVIDEIWQNLTTTRNDIRFFLDV